jgi:HlyD family secretion protein
VKKLLVVLLFIGMTLVATTFLLNHYSTAANDPLFELDEVQRGAITETISATGILKPLDVVAVGSPLSGEVVRLFDGADFNRVVAKGDPLVQLDDRAAKVKRDHAAVNVELAKADVQSVETAIEATQKAVTRAQDLLKKAVIKQSELDQAEAALKVAQAKRTAAEVKVREAEQGLRAAELELSLTTIRAPAGGIIIDKKVVLGQLVAPPASAQLFTIATNLQRMRIDAQIAEGDIGKVQAGLKATFTVYPYPDPADVFEGVVKETRLMATNVQGAVFFPAIIEVENRPVPGTKANEWMHH